MTAVGTVVVVEVVVDEVLVLLVTTGASVVVVVSAFTNAGALKAQKPHHKSGGNHCAAHCLHATHRESV